MKRFCLCLTLLLAGSGAQAADTLHRVRPDEDWTTPHMATTHLQAAAPLVYETDDRPHFTRELITVGWRPFDSFTLFVIKPKGIARPPVALYLYSYNSGTKRFYDDSYCERITAGGCAAVGFESALSGDRFKMRPMREWFVSELPESLSASAHDVQMILNYLATRPDLDMAHVGMFGQGSGGAVAVLAAAADPRIKAIDLLSPWGDWPNWLPQTTVILAADRKRFTRPAFAKSVAGLDPVRWLPLLKGRKVRLLEVEDDATMPAACRAAYAHAAPPGAIISRYANNLQIYQSLGDGRLFQWLGQKLGAKPAPVPGVSVP